MKKYLMTGVAAVAMVAAMTSCSHDETLYQPSTPQEKFQAEFVAQFGEIAKDQNWGFTNVKPMNMTETRSHNVNRNEWGTGNGIGGSVAVPKNLNDPTVNANEQQLVYNYFNKKREGAVNQNNVIWTDYFITEVWKGEDVYKDGANGDVKGSDHMNHLQVLKGEGSIDANGNLVGAWEHANDFNNGDHSSSWNTIVGHTFMYNSGTYDFAYHNTTDSKYHNEYIIIPGAEIDPSLAGYYYVGFDFYATHPTGQEANRNMDVARDWVFTDWIVRISPAEFLQKGRIIAEDLSASTGSDFDYNDVVFDVALVNEYVQEQNANRLIAHITLQAAGGTMPLYIGGKANGKEVHELFGVSTTTMVNTNEGTVSKAPVQFCLDLGPAVWDGTYSYKNIPVDVETPQGLITLGVETGEAPEKICVETRYKWCNERKAIQNIYPAFKDWVGNRSVVWY